MTIAGGTTLLFGLMGNNGNGLMGINGNGLMAMVDWQLMLMVMVDWQLHCCKIYFIWKTQSKSVYKMQHSIISPRK